MNPSYRYVVFPPSKQQPGKQPTVEEVTQLNAWAKQTKSRYAAGVSADHGGLVLAFEAPSFDAALSSRGPLADLVQRWHGRGGVVLEKHPFIKNLEALQPTYGGFDHHLVERRTEPTLKRKQLAAQEALGRAGLRLQHVLQRNSALQQLAVGVPYALIALGTLLVILLGFHLSSRLTSAAGERRRETIERVAEDALQEDLSRQPRESR